MSERGRFITFEGIDGAGKSTQIDVVAECLGGRGIAHLRTREPGGTPLAEALRELILNEPMTAATETLLLFAARAEHLARVIEPALAAGQWVLCDRFTDATYAYQAGGRGMSSDAIGILERWVHPTLQPDLTLLFDLAPELAAARLSAARIADRFEAEPVEFFAAVRAQYLLRAQADPRRFLVIDGAQPANAIRAQLVGLIAQWSG